MDPSSPVVFAAIFGIACASPGPTITALVARVLARGVGGMPAFCLALLLGDLVWLACAVYGVVLCAYVLLAARARRLIRSARAMRIVNRATGTTMVGAAVAVATRTS